MFKNVNQNRKIMIYCHDRFERNKKFYVQNVDEKKKFIFRKKRQSYDLTIVNRNSLSNKNEKMNEKIISLLTKIQQHHEKFIFDVVEMIIHDIILKMF